MICSHPDCTGKHSHTFPRAELCPAFLEQDRERMRIYAAAHREEARARTLAWNKANPERKQANGRAWNKANPGYARHYFDQNGGAYVSWMLMKQRCLNNRNPDYPRYGGRGVSVCAGLMSYPDFIQVLCDRPPDMGIDRIDPYGSYACGQCKECIGRGQICNVGWADDDT